MPSACFKTCGFCFTVLGGLEGISPPRKALFWRLAAPPLCQAPEKAFCGGGEAAPACPPRTRADAHGLAAGADRAGLGATSTRAARVSAVQGHTRKAHWVSVNVLLSRFAD